MSQGPAARPIGRIDAGNSTTTPLGPGATFTGTPIEVLGYTAISITLELDPPNPPGEYFTISPQFSEDGVTWINPLFEFMDFSSIYTTWITPIARYFRLEIVSFLTGTPTTFKVQTILWPTTQTAVPLTRATNQDLLTPVASENTLFGIRALLPQSAGRLNTNIGSWLGSGAPSVGSKTSVNSIPVVIASDQVPSTLGTKVSASSLSVTSAEDQTYSASTGPFAAPASPTDVFVITGSASRTIVVRKIILTATQTTGSVVRMSVVKRSADDTGGTSVADTKVPYDSAYAAATNTVRHYTANPGALGAIVGNVRDDKIYVPITTVVANLPQIWDFTENGSPGIRLRGVAEILALNLNATTVAGNSLNIDVEWSEVP